MLIKILFEYTRFFKLQNIVKKSNSFYYSLRPGGGGGGGRLLTGSICLFSKNKSSLEQKNQKLIGADRIRRTLDESTLCGHRNLEHDQATT